MPRSAGTLGASAYRAAPPGAIGRAYLWIASVGAAAARLSNASGRYEPLARIAFDDGWQSLDELPPFKTTVQVDATRKIITRNESPDISFDRSINPYRGCEHGCVYCFARPTHAYLGLSPGLDFETKLFMKPDAPQLLERELSATATSRAPSRSAPIPIPISRSRSNTRSCAASCEVLERAGHPVGIVTKSALVTARHRHSLAHGGAQSRQGRALGDDARSPSSRARWSRARRRRRGGSRRCGNCREPASRPR